MAGDYIIYIFFFRKHKRDCWFYFLFFHINVVDFSKIILEVRNFCIYFKCNFPSKGKKNQHKIKASILYILLNWIYLQFQKQKMAEYPVLPAYKPCYFANETNLQRLIIILNIYW